MIKEYQNINLRQFNTFGFDVNCRTLVSFTEPEELKDIFREMPSRWAVISGGSNILFTGDYDGLLIHPAATGVTKVFDDGITVRLRAGAGMVWDDFVEYCAGEGLWGAENLAGIPGNVGACPVQNIGAYGTEVKEIIESVEMFCVENSTMLTLANEHCGFGYRDSVFKTTLKGRVIITAVNFRLSRTPDPHIGYGDLKDMVENMGGPTLDNIREAVVSIRNSKLPDPARLGNAGSFFKNPVIPQDQARRLKDIHPEMPLYSAGDGLAKLACGWLIDQAGFKGYREGSVGVHEKQALVLVNYGGGTGAQVLALAEKVRDAVLARFGVEIEMEVNIL